MEKTKYARKLDTSGRLVIPIKLRDALNLNIGDTYTFYVHTENGKQFLCVDCSGESEENEISEELQQAIQLIEKNGMTIQKNNN